MIRDYGSTLVRKNYLINFWIENATRESELQMIEKYEIGVMPDVET